jgi:putative nucleotidyltransferase with HDIG domain
MVSAQPLRRMGRIRVYAGILAVLAIVSAAVPLLAEPLKSSGSLVEGAHWTLAPALIALTAISHLFPLTLAPNRKLTVSDAALFAAVLLYRPPVAMAIAGIGVALGQLVLIFTRGRYPSDLFLNAGKTALAVGLSGLLLHGIVGSGSPFALDRALDLLALPTAAALLYVTSTFSVSIAAWLFAGRNPWIVWLSGRRVDFLQTVALYLIGLVAALTSQQQPWTLLVMVLPTMPIYVTLKRTVQFLEQQMDQQTVSAVEAMADTVDMRLQYTFDHSKRVAAYAVEIAKEMGLPDRQVESIRLAARVHDLGKIGVPDHVLRKEGALTADERAQIDRHVQIGYEILARFSDYRDSKDLVLLHHQRWDRLGSAGARATARSLVPANGTAARPPATGQATPAAPEVTEETLLLGAQIIAVADGLDAMTSQRPYRHAMSLDDAMAEFHRYRGQQWHPTVVDALERLLAQPERARTLARVRLTPIPA